MTIAAAVCLQKFYSSDNGHLWVTGTLVWPTILNLLAALVITIWNGIVLCGYCFGTAVEKRWATHDGLAKVIQNTLSAFATGIMLGTASQPSSLENQSCSNTLPPTTVNVNTICTLQVHYIGRERWR